MESMGKKNLKVTNSRQFQAMVNLMEKNVPLAKSTNSLGKAATDEAWEEVAKEINLYGPPCRTGSEWKKIWCDLKCRTKKKVLENNKILNNGEAYSGRIYHLSELELSVDNIVQFSNTLLTEDLEKDSSAIDEDINELLTSCEVQMDIASPSTSQPETEETKEPAKTEKLFATTKMKSTQNRVFASRRNSDKFDLQLRLLQQQVKTQDKIFKVMKIQAAATKALAEAANRQAQALTTIASSSQTIALALEDVLKNIKKD